MRRASRACWPSGPLRLTLHGNRQCNEDQIKAALTPITERLEQYSVMLNQISEQQLLSDRAKSVAFREKDRDAVRRALQEEIGKKDWEAALVLVDEMERAYGYRQEADRFRQQINAAHDQFSRRQIADVVAVIDRHTRSEQWQAALREADRLRQMFPHNEQVKNLPVEIENRRQTHKKQLLDSWNEAVNRKDVDGAIEILEEARSVPHAVRGRGDPGTGPQHLQAEDGKPPHAVLRGGAGPQLAGSDPHRRVDHDRLPEHADGQGSSRKDGRASPARLRAEQYQSLRNGASLSFPARRRKRRPTAAADQKSLASSRNSALRDAPLAAHYPSD